MEATSVPGPKYYVKIYNVPHMISVFAREVLPKNQLSFMCVLIQIMAIAVI